MNLLARIDIKEVIFCAQLAGEKLLAHFYSANAHQITVKSDQSPVTQADIEANACIVSALTKIDSNIPILSEESDAVDFMVRKQWDYFWLIDPLDGTRGFISRDAQFCVNIALVEKNKPVIGVIYAPVEKYTVYAIQNQGAFLLRDGAITQIHTAKYDENHLRLFCGYHDPFRKPLRTHLGAISVTQMNSALKFGVIARGLGDLYVRVGPTSEWDTAAGQCIVEEAGGAVVDFEGRPLQYNAKPSLINPAFVAMGDTTQSKNYLDFIRKMQ